MHILISDKHEDDFIRNVVTAKATRDDGRTLVWKVPRRLIRREGMVDIVFEEMMAEMKEIWG
jgi:hypothetical protein